MNHQYHHLFKRYWIIVFLLLATGCQTTRVMQKTKHDHNPPKYSIIYVIHGDSDYLYHTGQGSSRQADEHALKEAKKTGLGAKRGEVLIFHQNPEHKILWLFPRKDRHFYYYRNGKLIHKQRYSPHSTKKSFATEARLYHKYSMSDDSSKKIFLYMGHEIPVKSNYSYDLSRPEARFNKNTFAQGVKSFLNKGSSFNLVVNSTCNNGTPAMVEKLSPYAHYILASPEDLHLSYIDTGRLSSLLNDGNSIAQTADSLAAYTYKRLSDFLETEITLSLYDTDVTKRYLPQLAKNYEKHLQTVSQKHLLDDNIDCADLPAFHFPKNNGVKTWYKPPQFGTKGKADSTFSGWGCKN